LSAGQVGEQHPAFVAERNLMAILNGLIVAVFLILLVASVAVVGSMIALTLFDCPQQETAIGHYRCDRQRS
jgi:hypothetical protein